MTEPQPRRRAPGMTTRERREMLVQTALPLVAEYGAAVTTAQIARAAGIGEATIFRAFTDKDELLHACVAHALDPTALLRELGSISLEQPLADPLVEAADTLGGHLGRMGAVLGALHGSGQPRRRSSAGTRPDGPAGRSTNRDAAQAATLAAVTELFEPDQASLRLPATTLAALFLTFLHGRRQNTGVELPTADLVDLFLHVALRGQPDSSPTSG